MQDVNNKSLHMLGKAIKTFRNQRKWRLSTLSRRAGIEPSTLKRIEDGTSEPKYLTLESIIDALDISLSKFFEFLEGLTKNK